MYNKLKSSRMSAMINKDHIAKNLYSTMLGEIDKIAKDKQVSPSDNIVETVANKMYNTINSNIVLYKEKGIDYTTDQRELELVREFVPVTLSHEQTATAVSEAISSIGPCANMGKVMAELKSKYGNTLDMRLASKLVKDAIM